MVKNIEQNNRSNLELGLQIAKQKIVAQASANQSIDAKVGILLGFAGAIAAGTIAIIKSDPSLIGFNVFIFGLFGLLVSILCLILASCTRTFYDPPDFDTFYSQKALAKDNHALMNQVISDTKKSYLLNADITKDKAAYFDRAIYLLGLGIILLIIGVI